ncbi:hypothetical protein [Streptomyces nitrosporeus]|uniref:hypothetical protein n=1 Tax=Streptomyces nitrosporeus TaxID=28894 RepID=UPI0039A25B37
MTGQPKLMTAKETRTLVHVALADPEVDLTVPLGLSPALREGLRTPVLAALSRGDHHPAVGDVLGRLTYQDGDRVRVAALSAESELLLSACLER